MRARLIIPSLFLMLFGGVALAPQVAATEASSADEQSFTVNDTRTGTAPCGFAVRRDLSGTITFAPRIDDAGNLVLSITSVDMRGTLTNPANDKAVDIRWVHRNGKISVAANGATTEVLLGLEGSLFRGYDAARAELALDQPNAASTVVAFTPGEHADEPWAHACGLLA